MNNFQDFIMSVNLWLVEFFGGKKEELLIIEMVLFLRLSCVLMSNFIVLHFKLLINSKIIFLLLWIESGKLSPSCNKYLDIMWNLTVKTKLTSHFFLLVSKEGSMLIFRLWHNSELVDCSWWFLTPLTFNLTIAFINRILGYQWAYLYFQLSQTW